MEQNRCPGCMEIKSGGAVCEHCGYDERNRNETHQLPEGTTLLLGKYLVGRALGQGGFGITYLGWNRYLDTKVAIKEYYPSVFVERDTTCDTTVFCKSRHTEELFAENRMRFLREAKVLAKLKEVPQIVSILDFFEENNTAYIVMEYLQGYDLKNYVRKKGGSLSPAQTLNIMRPVMAALVQVHEAGLVHRDISPDNIMLRPDGSVKLMDFGAVRSVNNPDVDKELTQATQAIVKHGFAPVEQYSSRGSIGPWTDEYALCATMYYCMTGHVPMNATDRIEEEAPIDWDGIAGLTARQKKILQKGTAIRAKDRYRSIRELMDALFGQPAQQEKPKQETEKPTPKKQNEAAKPGKKGMILLIAVLVLAVAAVAVMLLPNGWVLKDGHRYYYKTGFKVTGLQEIEDDILYFDSKGRSLSGWQEIDGRKYFFSKADGKALRGFQFVDGNNYYFGSDGAMLTGWQILKNNSYYFDSEGRMATGIQTIDGDRYYFTGKGIRRTGQQMENGEHYYFGEDGKMVTGWIETDGIKYYYDDVSGKLVCSIREKDGGKYLYDQNGEPLVRWQTIGGKKYHCGATGRIMTGWRDIDGARYYFTQDGVMLTGVQILGTERYIFGNDGKLVGSF